MNDQRHVIFSQRKNLINNGKINKYTSDFIDEIINNLNENKNEKLMNPKNEDLNIKIRSIFGKINHCIYSLIYIDNNNFVSFVKSFSAFKSNSLIIISDSFIEIYFCEVVDLVLSTKVFAIKKSLSS